MVFWATVLKKVCDYKLLHTFLRQFPGSTVYVQNVVAVDLKCVLKVKLIDFSPIRDSKLVVS